MHLGVQTDDIYILVRDRGFDIRYVLLARRDGAVTDLADLVTQRLAFFDNPITILAVPWLETLLAEHSGQTKDRGLKELVAVDTPSKAILQVFFRQAQPATAPGTRNPA